MGAATTIDYREVAPARATRDMFLDEQGNAVAERSRMGPLAAGVPGAVAGLLHAHKQYGRLPLAKVIAPAIALAHDGFDVSLEMAKSFQSGVGQAVEVSRRRWRHSSAATACRRRKGNAWSSPTLRRR